MCDSNNVKLLLRQVYFGAKRERGMEREEAQRRTRDMREHGLDLTRTLVHVIFVKPNRVTSRGV